MVCVGPASRPTRPSRESPSASPPTPSAPGRHREARRRALSAWATQLTQEAIDQKAVQVLVGTVPCRRGRLGVCCLAAIAVIPRRQGFTAAPSWTLACMLALACMDPGLHAGVRRGALQRVPAGVHLTLPPPVRDETYGIGDAVARGVHLELPPPRRSRDAVACMLVCAARRVPHAPPSRRCGDTVQGNDVAPPPPRRCAANGALLPPSQ